MIGSFKNKALRKFAETGNAKGLPVQNADRVTRILAMLEAAKNPRDMDQPGMMFHSRWDKRGEFSVRVSGNYRVTFNWRDGKAVDVDLLDYH